MRYKMTPALMAALGLVLVAWSCNIQPGGVGKAPEALPDPVTASSAELKAEPGAHKRKPGSASAKRRMKPIQPVKLTGPKESKPAPLPKADKTIAIFHSGNVDGEVDPCG